MTFLAPIWLLGLLPWMAVTLYLLSGRRARAAVPFLALWEGPVTAPRPQRAWVRPPPFLLLMIAAMLLALMAAAGPALRGRDGGTITIVLDRGVSMSPFTAGEPFRGVVSPLARELARRLDSATVDLITVPGSSTPTTLSQWASVALASGSTALDTHAALDASVAERLGNAPGPVIILSDQILSSASDRVIQVPPATGVENIGIDAIGARALPRPQVMVRLRNESSSSQVSLRVLSGGQRIEQIVQLPSSGQLRDYFFDIPGGLASSARVEIDSGDSATVDDRAWLVAEAAWPVVEPRTTLSPAMARMIEAYAKLRPGGPDSAHVAITDDPELSTTEPAVRLLRAGGGAKNAGAASVRPHEVTANVVTWPAPANATASVPSGFSAIVSAGLIPLVAMRTEPARQVWVNLDLDAWSGDRSFVIFLANVLDWVGTGGGQNYVAHTVALLAPEWTRTDDSPAPAAVAPGLWPGLYRRGDGRLTAVNSPAVRWDRPRPTVDWKERLRRVVLTSGTGYLPLWPCLCLAALACASGAAFLWPMRRPGKIISAPAQDRPAVAV